MVVRERGVEELQTSRRLTGNRFQSRAPRSQLGNSFRRYGEVWITDLAERPSGTNVHRCGTADTALAITKAVSDSRKPVDSFVRPGR
jgi:hypothetical protein